MRLALETKAKYFLLSNKQAVHSRLSSNITIKSQNFEIVGKSFILEPVLVQHKIYFAQKSFFALFKKFKSVVHFVNKSIKKILGRELY